MLSAAFFCFCAEIFHAACALFSRHAQFGATCLLSFCLLSRFKSISTVLFPFHAFTTAKLLHHLRQEKPMHPSFVAFLALSVSRLHSIFPSRPNRLLLVLLSFCSISRFKSILTEFFHFMHPNSQAIKVLSIAQLTFLSRAFPPHRAFRIAHGQTLLPARAPALVRFLALNRLEFSLSHPSFPSRRTRNLHTGAGFYASSLHFQSVNPQRNFPRLRRFARAQFSPAPSFPRRARSTHFARPRLCSHSLSRFKSIST